MFEFGYAHMQDHSQEAAAASSIVASFLESIGKSDEAIAGEQAVESFA